VCVREEKRERRLSTLMSVLVRTSWVCVCVCEREREREKEKEGERRENQHLCHRIHACEREYVCVCERMRERGGSAP